MVSAAKVSIRAPWRPALNYGRLHSRDHPWPPFLSLQTILVAQAQNQDQSLCQSRWWSNILSMNKKIIITSTNKNISIRNLACSLSNPPAIAQEPQKFISTILALHLTLWNKTSSTILALNLSTLKRTNLLDPIFTAPSLEYKNLPDDPKQPILGINFLSLTLPTFVQLSGNSKKWLASNFWLESPFPKLPIFFAPILFSCSNTDFNQIF